MNGDSSAHPVSPDFVAADSEPARPTAVSVEAIRRWSALGAVCLASFLLSLEDTAVSVVLPQIRRDLGVSLVGLEWVVNSYTLSMAALILPAGRLADAIGPRRVFLWGTGIFVAGGLAAGLAQSEWLLLAARVLQAAGGALSATAALAIVSASFEGRRRGAALGVWAGVSAMGLGLGPLLGALLTEGLAWQWVFIVNVPLGAIIFAVAHRALPDIRGGVSVGRLPVVGLLFATAAMLALLLALTEGQRLGWSSPSVAGLGTAAVISLLLFLRHESHSDNRLVDARLSRSRAFRAANVVTLLSTAVMCNLFFFLSLFFQLALGYSPLEAGASLLPLTAVIVIAAPIAGRISDRIGPRWPIACGMALLGSALIALAITDTQGGIRSMLPWLVLAGAGIGVTSTPTTAAALDAAPPEQAGMAAGLVNMSRLVGLTIGIATMGAILSASGVDVLASGPGAGERFADGLSTAFALNAGIAIVAAVIAAISFRRSNAARSSPDAIA